MRWLDSGPVFAPPVASPYLGLMLLQGLQSAEVLVLNPDDVLLSEGQLRVRGKGGKLRFLPLAPETVQLLEHYMRLERPNPCSAALFVSFKGPARGQRMPPAGLRSLFRQLPEPKSPIHINLGTMPGPGLFRVTEVCVDERPVNAGAERVRSRNYPA